MNKRVTALIESICGDVEQPLAPVLLAWCSRSRAFVAFADAHTSKIRKKAQLITNAEELSDLLSELAVAELFLRDQRFAVKYESRRAVGKRSPDLEVVYKTHTAMLVEVTRLRPPQGALNQPEVRLARVLCDKIEQFPVGVMNLLVVVLPPEVEQTGLVAAATLQIERFTEQAGSALRLAGVRAFQSGRQRLSGVALCSFSDDWQLVAATLWLNPGAKHTLTPEMARSVSHWAS